MTNSVENLQNSVSDVQIQLAELKDNVELSAKEKKEKADSLKSTADNLLHQIESALEALRSSTDADAQEKIEKLETSKEVLQQISDLYTSILASLEAEEKEEKEEKWFWDSVKEKFWNAKDWVWIQWNDVRDKDKRKNDTGKNLLRTTWFVATGVWIWALIYSWCKRLFGKEAREERRKNRKERREARRKAREERRKEIAKLPFWERPIWKVIKWTGIWTAAYLIIHWIHTWDWFKDFFKRWTKKTETAVEQVNHYKELSPEVREKYESIWDNVNKFYGNVWGKEISYGYESPYDLWTISKNVAADAWISDAEVYKWLVPFCMDDGIANIKDLLSEKNYTTYLFDKDVTEIIEKIKGWALSTIGKALWSFVSSLESFLPFSKGSGSLWEKIENWINADPQNRINELNFFFRQYAKVLTYMKDKEKSIAYKIVEEKCYSELDWKSENDKNIFIQNKLKDDDWFKQNVESDVRYQKFMSSKVVGSGEVLSSINLFNWDMSPVLKTGIIDPINDRFDDILQVDEESETIIDKYIEEIDAHNLWTWTQWNLMKMCEDLDKDMIDDDGWILQCFKGFQYLFNNDEANMEKFLKESWLENFVNWLRNKLSDYRTKIEAWNISKDELQKLKELALAYFAFEKEVNLATYTIGSVREDNPDAIRRLIESNIMWFNNFICAINKIFSWDAELWDYCVFGVWVAQWCIVFYPKTFVKATWKFVKWTYNTGKRTVKHVNPFVWIAWRPSLSNRGFEQALKWLNNLAEKESYFLHYALNWKIRDERFLINVAKTDLWMTTNPSKMSDVFFELLKWQWVTPQDCDLLWKYAWNSDIKKLLITQANNAPVTDYFSSWFKHIGDTFTVNSWNLAKLRELDEAVDLFESSGSYANSSKFIRDMLNNSVKKVEDLDSLKVIVNETKFWDIFEEGSSNLKATRNSLKHVDNVRNSSILTEIELEIERATTLTGSASKAKLELLNTHITELKKFRKSFISMNPKAFNQIEDFVKILGDDAGDICSQAKIINKIFNEWIELTDDTKKVFQADEIEGILKDPTNLERYLRDAKPTWRRSVDLASEAKLTKFTWRLRKVWASKKFLKNVDDYITTIRKTVKVIAKIS